MFRVAGQELRRCTRLAAGVSHCTASQVVVVVVDDVNLGQVFICSDLMTLKTRSDQFNDALQERKNPTPLNALQNVASPLVMYLLQTKYCDLLFL